MVNEYYSNLSVLLVSYQTLRRQTDKAASQKTTKSTEVDKPLPNILLVTYDALTAREMSLYDYHRPTTPFISQWAKTASLFTREFYHHALSCK
ncbi:MAG: sulfatase-like hydrolase/transferase [Nitrospirae bacterium]|nr:sulfatase-like hydrolase/transferase [Nitrospirota bacterium]